MLKKLLLILILGMIMAGPATPIFKSFFGIGSSIAYADQGEDNDDQGEDNDDQ